MIWYVTVPTMLPVLTRESLMKVPGVTELLNPVIVPRVLVDVHVKSVPVTFDVRAMFVLVFEQIGFIGGVVSNGIGLTVTIKFAGVPTQLSACGVI